MDSEPDDHEIRLIELFNEHYPSVLAYAARRTDPESARDAAAETFVIACRRQHSIPAGFERPWLLTTARYILDKAAAAGYTYKGLDLINAKWIETSTLTTWVPVDESQPTWRQGSRRRIVKVIEGPPLGTLRRLLGDTGISADKSQPPGADWQNPSTAFMASLPTDPDLLRQRIYDDSAWGGPSPDAEAFVYVSDILGSSRANAQLRAALFRVLATISGMEITSRAASVNGRTGIAFSRFEQGWSQREELVVDPATGELVGTREVNSGGTIQKESVSTGTLVDAVPNAVTSHGDHWIRYGSKYQPFGAARPTLHQ